MPWASLGIAPDSSRKACRHWKSKGVQQSGCGDHVHHRALNLQMEVAVITPFTPRKRRFRWWGGRWSPPNHTCARRPVRQRQAWGLCVRSQ